MSIHPCTLSCVYALNDPFVLTAVESLDDQFTEAAKQMVSGPLCAVCVHLCCVPALGVCDRGRCPHSAMHVQFGKAHALLVEPTCAKCHPMMEGYLQQCREVVQVEG